MLCSNRKQKTNLGAYDLGQMVKKYQIMPKVLYDFGIFLEFLALHTYFCPIIAQFTLIWRYNS